MWRAVCGNEITPQEAEEVSRFIGAPCSPCLLAAIGNGRDARVDTAARTRMGTYPAYAPISPTGWYAVALWDERKVHFVAADATRGHLEGREVVQALCGHLGWGPLAPESVPRRWPRCAECQSFAAKSS